MSKQLLENLLDGISYNDSKSFGKIRFIPIVGKLDTVSSQVDVVSENISGIKISELESESVNQVNIESSYEKPLLVMPGIILEGGRQTRSPVRPFIINKGSKKTVPVNCIEQNRWSYSPEARVSENEKEFKFASKYVTRKTKSTLTSRSATQGTTWSNISLMRSSAGLSAGEASSDSQMEIEEIAFKKSGKKVETIRKELEPVFTVQNQRGIIIMEDNQIVSVEVFETPNLWGKISKNVLESNLFDLLQEDAKENEIETEIKLSMNDFELEQTKSIADEDSFAVKFKDLEGWAVSDKENMIYLTVNKAEKSNNDDHMQIQEMYTQNIAQEQSINPNIDIDKIPDIIDEEEEEEE